MGRIIWLASYPKSGNTWLRVFLHNLLRNPDRPWDINSINKFTTGDSKVELYRQFDPRPATAYAVEDVARMRPLVQAALTQASRDNVFVKTHCALLEDHGYPTINLEVTAGTIYIVRNPLDIVVSFAAHIGKTIDQAISMTATRDARMIATENAVTELRGSWSQHVESWTRRAHPTLHVVRYEDMLQSPTTAFGGIARFLGLAPSESRLAGAIEMSSFAELQGQERRKGFSERLEASTEAFFRKGRSGQWREALSGDQVAAVVLAHRIQMARFDYVPTGL